MTSVFQESVCSSYFMLEFVFNATTFMRTRLTWLVWSDVFTFSVDCGVPYFRTLSLVRSQVHVDFVFQDSGC